MADQPITGLPTKTASGVATTDKMLGIDSAEGYQILVQDVAKYIIENYGGSTLAGAVRTPKAAIDLLNSKTTVITLPTTDVTSSNAIYALYDARSNSESFRQRITIPNPSFDGLPSGNCVLEGYRNSANYGWLRLTTYGEPYGTVFSNVKTNGTWSGWKLVPTRDEIDTLNSKTETKDLGSKSTLSDFNNSLTTLANTMNSKQIYNIRIVASGSALSPFQYATYYGTLTKNTSTSFFAHLSCGLDEIHGEYTNNDWVWENTFADSGWITLIDGIFYRKHHGITYVSFNVVVSLSTTDITIGTLPEGYRPSKVAYFRLAGSTGIGNVTVFVYTNGTIHARVDSGTGNAINGLISLL